MAANDRAKAIRTHVLGTYTVDGRKRRVLALRHRAATDLQMVDVLAELVGGCDDRRAIEESVGCLDECKAIARDYIALAKRLGWPPMPETWW